VGTITLVVAAVSPPPPQLSDPRVHLGQRRFLVLVFLAAEDHDHRFPFALLEDGPQGKSGQARPKRVT
jgi:hypothetical protein